MTNELGILSLFLEEYVKAKEEYAKDKETGVGNMMSAILVTDNVSIHVFDGDKLVDIYTKETGVPKILVEEDGADRDGDFKFSDEELLEPQLLVREEDGADRDGDILDKEWARDRNREIEKEVWGLRETLNFNGTKLKPERVKKIKEKIKDLLEERDDNTFKYGLAGKAFERLYLEKKDGDFEFSDEELEDPQLLARDEEKNTEENLMYPLDRINSNYDKQKWIDEHTWNNHYVGRPFIYVDDIQELLVSKQGVESDVFKDSEDSLYDKLISSGIPMSVIEEEPKDYSHKPNDNEARFKKITKEMLNLYSRKNTDYGGSFDESLDEDGLLVAKIKFKDKLNRFSQLIDNDALVYDETMRDTLIDLGNYAIMTLMWLDENETD